MTFGFTMEFRKDMRESELMSGPFLSLVAIMVASNFFSCFTYLMHLLLPHFRRNLLTFVSTISKDSHISPKDMDCLKRTRNVETYIHSFFLVGLSTLITMLQGMWAFKPLTLSIWQRLDGESVKHYSDMKWWMILISALVAYPLQADVTMSRVSVHAMAVMASKTFSSFVSHFIDNIVDSKQYCCISANEVILGSKI